ncbi:phosphatase [Alginatibacterium sediminis]|uniref:Phosphatase n=1 Tax=Alginatibacterium sediminis TaxID=2164068 RepID=A0A420E9M4_9ALTE|nr:phosphatase [Alginatibacterium sediminis]RKF15932.1 phosphatase [Alginatibacterium sediminis]
MKITADIHAHTIASTHAYSTVQDYINIASSKGIQLFAITDHGPDMADAPHYWHFVNMKVIPRIVNGIGILRGMEANIKNADGQIDCDENLRGCLDIILAGFHQPVFKPSTLEINTQALINAIESQKVDIISHPGNPAYPIDIKKVAQAAADNNVALEINNSSFIASRQGSEPNCREIVKTVKGFGGKLAIGSDSHFSHSLGEFDKALEILEKEQFPSENIVNRDPKALIQFLEQRGHSNLGDYRQLWA